MEYQLLPYACELYSGLYEAEIISDWKNFRRPYLAICVLKSDVEAKR